VSVPETSAPAGVLPDTVASLFTTPASTSACDGTYDAVHTICSPGTSTSFGHASSDVNESTIPIPSTVTFPVFVTTNVYEIGVDTSKEAASADFTTDKPATGRISVSVEP